MSRFVWVFAGSLVLATTTACSHSPASTADAGMPADSGFLDAGTSHDAGGNGEPPDSGAFDAGSDAGPADSGTPDAGSDAGPPDSGTPDAGLDAGPVDAGPTAIDFPCTSCMTFPALTAPACAAGALGAPVVAYPLDGQLLPPNLNVLEVQFVPPAGATLFEVDFSNAITDVRVEATCNPIMPVRGGASSGCGITLPQAAWNDLATTNADGDPVNVTVRATVDGTCVSSSTGQIAINFAGEAIAGGVYYWQSGAYGGIDGKTGGINGYDFSSSTARSTPFYSPGTAGTCTGCHSVSRDGVRMSVTYDDPDGDDEFGDDRVAVLDVASRNVVGGKAVSPGFQTWSHDHARMVTSTYKMGQNQSFALFDSDGQTMLASGMLPPMMLATQPALSADDSTLVYVVPAQASGYGISTAGDHHFFGGSLYVSSFDPMTNALGTPTPLLVSQGTPPNATNAYYPSIAPDGSFVVFDSAPSGDAYYNVNARVKLLHLPVQANAQPLDLPALNVADGLSNSWPRWSPFVQMYKGHRLLWVTFSSNRDYGLHLTNAGFPNCYPPESPTYDQPQPLSRTGGTYANCAQPQIWMAGVIVDPDPSLDATDRSFPAFWLPYQDVTAHAHSAEWVEQVQSASPEGASCGETGAACGGASPLCCSDAVCCNGMCEPACSQ